MSKIKKMSIWAVKPGMIVLRCDKSGVPFNEYARPLTYVEGLTALEQYGVENVYIWSDKEEPLLGINYNVQKENDINWLNIAAALELLERSKSNVGMSIENIKRGSVVEGQSLKKIVSDMIFLLYEVPGIFGNVVSQKGTNAEVEHAIDVCIYSLLIGQKLNLSQKELEDIGLAAILHDVGMVRVPSKIADKKGALSDQELAVIKNHPALATQILEKNQQINSSVSGIILQHHEFCDGTGYPSSLTERYLTTSAKILAVAEAYDSMRIGTFDTPQLKIKTEAVKKIYSGAGKQFNPSVVKAFIASVGIFPVGSLVRLSNKDFGIVCEINSEDNSKPKILSMGMDGAGTYELINLKNQNEIKVVSALDASDFNIDTDKIFIDFLYSRIKSKIKS